MSLLEWGVIFCSSNILKFLSQKSWANRHWKLLELIIVDGSHTNYTFDIFFLCKISFFNIEYIYLKKLKDVRLFWNSFGMILISLSPALNGRASVELGSLCFKQILKLLKLADEFSWNWFHEKKLENKEINHHQICLPLDFSRNWGTSLCFTLYSWVASSLDLKLRPPQHLDHCRRLTQNITL